MYFWGLTFVCTIVQKSEDNTYWFYNCAGEVFGRGQDGITHSNSLGSDHCLHHGPSYRVETCIGYDRSATSHHSVLLLQESAIEKHV